MIDWHAIPGWLTDAEGERLAALAAGRVVVELGTWKGRSAAAMARTALHVTCCDSFAGDAETGPADTFAAFLDAVGHLPHVTSYVADFAHGLPALADRSADLVFIDGAHDRASVARDSAIARRLLRPGGVVAYHDYTYPSVSGAAEAAGFQPVGRVDSLAWGHYDDAEGA